MNGAGIFFFLLLLLTGWTLSDENVSPFPIILTPRNYSLTFLSIMELSPRTCGHVWIDSVARISTTMAILHATDLTIHRVIVLPLKGSKDPQPDATDMVEELCFSSKIPEGAVDGDILLDFHHDNVKEMLTILLSETLIRGDSYRIGVLYTGEIDTNGGEKGFFRLKYPSNQYDEEKNNCCPRLIGATQLEAIYARRVFPCLDEPAYKATFKISIGHLNNHKAISNMPLKSTTSMKLLEHWIWDEFETSPPMSTYLVAIILTELSPVVTSYTSIDGRNVTLRLWAREHLANQLEFALDFVPKVLVQLEEYLQIPYSLPKLDMITIPGFDDGKAMENWGLIVHSETNMLVDKDSSSEIDKALVASTIVHEIAHQWFGNLVTSRWWDDIWLNEGLTTLFESMFTRQIVPEIDTDLLMVVFLSEAMKSDLVGSAMSLNEPVERFNTIEDKFSPISYSKGGAIFRMVKNFVGEDAFQSAIARYLKQYQYGVANSTDFWGLVNQEARRAHTISCRMSIARVMKTWTQQPGYPLVHVHRGKDGFVHLSQKPFPDPDFVIDNATMAISASWWIPITMTDAESLKFSVKDLSPPLLWLSPRKPSAEIPGPKSNDSWIIVNIQASGYYRVNYDRRNWELLAEQLLKDHTVIPAVTRAQLIDDAFNMAQSRIISFEIPSMLTAYLTMTSDDSLIRQISNKHVGEMMAMMEQEELDDAEKESITTIVSMVTRDQRRSGGRGRSHSVSEAVVDGYCDAGDQICVSEALRLFRAEANKSITAKQTKTMKKHFEEVWCAAIRHGSGSDWDFAWKESSGSSSWKSSTEMRKMLKALSCTVDLAQQKQLLSRIFNPNIAQTPKETSVILSAMAENRSARSQALNFILRNWNFLMKHFQNPSEKLADLLTIFAKNIHSTEDVEKVSAFLKQKSTKLDPASSERILTTMRNSIRRRVTLSSIHLNDTAINSNDYNKNRLHRWKEYL